MPRRESNRAMFPFDLVRPVRSPRGAPPMEVRTAAPAAGGVRPAGAVLAAAVLAAAVLAGGLLAACGSNQGGAGGATSPVAPRAQPRQLTGLDLFVGRSSIRVGQVIGPVVAYGRYDDGTTGTLEAVWTSSDPTVAAVTEDGATLTGIGSGEAEITATFEERSQSLEIEVSEPNPRATADRLDDFDGPQIHVVYALPSNAEDRNLDRYGNIADSFEAIQGWISDEIGRRLRLDTYEGELDVTFLRLSFDTQEGDGTNLDLVGRLLDETRAAIGQKPDTIYAFYYQGRATGLCGSAPRPGPAAAVYVSDSCSRSIPGADPEEASTYEAVMLHELLHAFGAVPDCAPSQGNGAHVTDDPTDVMYAGVERGGRDEAVIDTGRDDYFGHGRASCLDTAHSPYWDPVSPGAASRTGFRPRVRIPPEDRPLRCGLAQH